jgi:uncharacterized protein YdeI (YjbR/CyaY-like superfamily)
VPVPKRLFRTAADWRAWLEKNHAVKSGIWLIYYKKSAGKRSVTYKEALDEALCFGWIDSVVNRVDAERYMQKWTPRNPGSVWSAANKARVGKLTAAGRMDPAGLAKVEAAKCDCSWDRLSDIDRIGRPPDIPDDLTAALAAVPAVLEKFERLAPSQKKLWAWWIISAKKPETRARRIAETVKGVAVGRRPGM